MWWNIFSHVFPFWKYFWEYFHIDFDFIKLLRKLQKVKKSEKLMKRLKICQKSPRRWIDSPARSWLLWFLRNKGLMKEIFIIWVNLWTLRGRRQAKYLIDLPHNLDNSYYNIYNEKELMIHSWILSTMALDVYPDYMFHANCEEVMKWISHYLLNDFW